MPAFDWRSAQASEVTDLAWELPGLTLGEIPGASFRDVEGGRGRGEAGAAIEAYFGIPPNSTAGADFPAAGIELKSVPLVAKSGRLRVKERTVISQIDYMSLPQESWGTASVRKKLRILFVFFEHLVGRPKSTFPIRHVALWEPTGPVEEQIRRDWERVRAKIAAGLAHELSESDGRILGPCTKAANSSVLRRQPASDALAKPRAFALKPFFTLELFDETRRASFDAPKIAELSNLEKLLRGFRRFEGRMVGDVAAELDARPSISKSLAANVVRRAVRAASPVQGRELERTLTIRTPRVDPDRMPYEAISFPAFRHLELIEEEWEDSDLLSRLEHMLFVPVFGRLRSTPAAECTIGRPTFWEPTAEQLATIEREWTTYRDLIRSGRADDLPKESQTTAIHVRPHGRDSTDRDEAPGTDTQIRKSFWLNKRFVQEILRTG